MKAFISEQVVSNSIRSCSVIANWLVMQESVLGMQDGRCLELEWRAKGEPGKHCWIDAGFIC